MSLLTHRSIFKDSDKMFAKLKKKFFRDFDLMIPRTLNDSTSTTSSEGHENKEELNLRSSNNFSLFPYSNFADFDSKIYLDNLDKFSDCMEEEQEEEKQNQE